MITKKFLSDESGLTVALETILLFAISVIFLGMIFYSFQDMNEKQSKVLIEEELLTIGNSIAKQMSDITVESRASNTMGSHTTIISEFWIPYNIADSAYRVTLMPGKINLETTSSPYISVEVPVNSDINLAEDSTIYSNDGKYSLEYDSKSSAIYFSNGGVVPFPDSNPPTISIDAPPDNDEISGKTYINTTPWDDSGYVSRVEFYVNQAWQINAGSPYKWLWNTLGEVDGNYTVTAIAYDAAGHRTPASRNYTVYNPFSNAPVITIISPLDGENTTFKKPIIKAVITDDKQLNFSSITLKIGTNYQTSNATFVNVPLKKSTLTYTPSQNMAIGNYIVEISAADVNTTPNSTTKTWSFNITDITDAALPTAEIVYPIGTTTLEPGSTITVTYRAYDLADSGLENLTINVKRSDGLLYKYQENISIYPYVVYQIDPQETWANSSNKYVGGNNYTYNFTVFDRAGKQSDVISVGPLSIALPGQASELEVITNGVTRSTTNLQNITLKNNVSDSVSVSITSVNISWSGTQQIERVRFGTTTYWAWNGAGTPDGKQNSGTLLNLVPSYPVSDTSFGSMDIRLSANVLSGQTFTIVFYCSDTTTRTVTLTAP